MKKITLILGGIRSGKSVFAEQKAEYYSARPVYIATAVAGDAEMKERVQLHRERRGERYEAYEEPTDLRPLLRTLQSRTVLVDCLTVHLSNRMFQQGETPVLAELIAESDQYWAELNQIITENQLNVIFVSNEVGLAPIEMNRLGRLFQDLQGRWNRQVAALADEVFMVQAGLPQCLKKQAVHPFRLSCPSYVLPTGYIENVTFALDHVSDVQLLLFDSAEDDPLFKEETLMTLDYLAGDGDLTYSVHLQTAPLLFTAEGFEKRLRQTVKAMERLEALPLSGYTFHYDLPVPFAQMTSSLKDEVDETYLRFFQALRGLRGEDSVPWTLENTATPLSWLDRVVQGAGIYYCADIGHLLHQQQDLADVAPRLSRTKIIHLHGSDMIKGQWRDHRSVKENRQVFQLLEHFDGVLTIENYHKKLLLQSLDRLRTYF